MNERKIIVQSLDLVGDQRALEREGKRITRDKLKRWRNEIGRNIGVDIAPRSQSTLPSVFYLYEFSINDY